MAVAISSCLHNCGSDCVPEEVSLFVGSRSAQLTVNSVVCFRILAAFQRLTSVEAR